MANVKKYFIIALAAFILEVASTMYIREVSDRSATMVFWAFISPFLTLPFVGYMVESKKWLDRVFMAVCQGVGYGLGSVIVFLTS